LLKAFLKSSEARFCASSEKVGSISSEQADVRASFLPLLQDGAPVVALAVFQ